MLWLHKMMYAAKHLPTGCSMRRCEGQRQEERLRFRQPGLELHVPCGVLQGQDLLPGLRGQVPGWGHNTEERKALLLLADRERPRLQAHAGLRAEAEPDVRL